MSLVPSPPVKPLQVYIRRNKVATAPAPVLSAFAPSSDCLSGSSPMPVSPVAPNIDSLPIALRKGKHTCIFHPIAKFVSCDHISPSLCAFIMSVTNAYVPKLVPEVLFGPY